ncbi:hypothetical protein EOM82_05295 [bacterium]|nr:hypothetical protein [bacterium]
MPFCGAIPAECYAETNYVKYTGKVYHIFFHSLIIDTAAAFSSRNKDGYNLWMTTKDEFIALLPLLYKKDFVLINLSDIAEKNNEGKIVKKDLFLPAGKKPLIISVDDVNYYDYMKKEGFADRLTVDNNNQVTAIKIVDGVEYYDCEGDVVPILDSFVKLHPDFSHNGAKGIIAVTGYQGVFGYRITTLKGDALSAATLEAKKVAMQLIATGWEIASHSYTHSGKFRDASITIETLKNDTQKWKTKIGNVIGQTSIYISPFGCSFSGNDTRFRYLVSEGYYFYCPVYKEMTVTYGKDYVISNRLNFDGLTMLKYPERIAKYFLNPAEIIDQSRPALYVSTAKLFM